MNVTDRLVEVMARAADPEFFSVFDGLSEPSDSAWSARAAILARHSAALTALRKAEEEVGPTDAMIQAGHDALDGLITEAGIAEVWREMHRVLTSPPSTTHTDERMG